MKSKEEGPGEEGSATDQRGEPPEIAEEQDEEKTRA